MAMALTQKGEGKIPPPFALPTPSGKSLIANLLKGCSINYILGDFEIFL